MRFIYYCCFVILFNSFFCFGDRGERRPDAWARTPKVKKFVPWKQTSRSIVTSHISKKGCRKRKSISVSTRDQERIKKHIEQINIPDFVKTITELWIFPNDYEYEAVYKSLEEDAHVESKLGQDKIGIRILSNKLYEGCRIKKPAWALFDLGGKKIFMITCGEGTYQILPFIKNCFNVFKNLKKVFLGGICGCSSMEVDIGAVLIPKSYIFISKISLGDALNREKIEQDGSVEKKGKTYQYDHVYFYEKDIIETEFPLDFSLKIKDSLEAQGVIVYMGISCSSDSFVDSKIVTDSIQTQLGEILSLNMEDGQIADQCKRHSCEFYSVRIVSDHAGGTPREIVDGGKEKACRQLGSTFKILMISLAE